MLQNTKTKTIKCKHSKQCYYTECSNLKHDNIEETINKRQSVHFSIFCNKFSTIFFSRNWNLFHCIFQFPSTLVKLAYTFVMRPLGPEKIVPCSLYPCQFAYKTYI